MKTVQHDSDNIRSGWKNVEEFAEEALLIAFDGCHKIYLAMDQTEADSFKNSSIYATVESSTDRLATLHEWFDKSCGLQFINAVYNNAENPNAGYLNLISQGATWEDEDEDEDEDLIM